MASEPAPRVVHLSRWIDATLETSKANREIEKLRARITKLEQAVADRKWWEASALSDLDRLKRAITKAKIPMPPLKTETPHVARHLPNRRKQHKTQSVVARDGIWCRYCGKRTNQYTRQIDHVIPVSRGGTNDLDNLAVSCRTCNYRKGTQLLEECGMVLRPERGDGAPVEVE